MKKVTVFIVYTRKTGIFFYAYQTQ